VSARGKIGELTPPVELPPPSSDLTELRPAYGPWFWAAAAVGWSAIVFGVVSALTHPGATRPPALALWVIGLALLHDLVFAPLELGAAWILRRSLPRVARAVVMGALVVSGLVVLYAIPFATRWGAQADNPSLLPRDVGTGALQVLALVWLVAAAMLAARLRRRRMAP
jgi:hypothetical protein